MALSYQATGIVWFQPEHYDRLSAMFEDHTGLNSTYGEWLYAAESRRQALEQAGVRVLCVDIDTDEFPVVDISLQDNGAIAHSGHSLLRGTLQ